MDLAAYLDDLPNLSLCLCLILCRISMVTMLMPGFGEQALPATLRAALSFSLTVLLLPLLQPEFSGVSTNMPLPCLTIAIAWELVVGGMIGWLARLGAMVLSVAGQMLSLVIGLSSVLQPDPELGAETAVISRFFNYLAPLLLLASGAYILPIQAAIASYRSFPPLADSHTLASRFFFKDGIHTIIHGTESVMLCSVELLAPFLLLYLVWQIALGLFSKIVPNLQIYNLTTPLQVAGGLALLMVFFKSLLSVWFEAYTSFFNMLPGF